MKKKEGKLPLQVSHLRETVFAIWSTFSFFNNSRRCLCFEEGEKNVNKPSVVTDSHFDYHQNTMQMVHLGGTLLAGNDFRVRQDFWNMTHVS